MASRYCNEDGGEVSGIDFSAQYRSDMGLGVKLDYTSATHMEITCLLYTSTYGVKQNMHSGLVNSEVRMNDLFG